MAISSSSVARRCASITRCATSRSPAWCARRIFPRPTPSASTSSPRRASPMAGAARSPTSSSRAMASSCSTCCCRSEACSSPLTPTLSPPGRGRDPRSGRVRGIVARRSIVAVRAFHALVALLGFEAQRRDGTGLEAADADRLVRLLAIAVAAVLDAHQGGIDLGDQLALAIARAQLDRPLGLERSAIGDVGLREALFFEVLKRLRRFRQELGPPAQQLLAEIFELQRVHELLFIGRSIVWRKRRPHHLLPKPEPKASASI